MTRYSEISHFSHPQHTLKFDYSEFPFKCDGCKEAGVGSRYKCVKCDYDLHMHCAIPSPSILHPFYTSCSFQFYSRPPGDKPRYCNACERDVNGFLYHCQGCGFDLHPCCAKLPTVIDDGDQVKLYLYRKVGASCQKCGRKGRSWSYRSTCKKYNLHVACVKDMLVEANWPKDLRRSWESKGAKNNIGNQNVNKKLETRIPSLKNSLLQSNHRKSKGKVRKGFEMAGLGMQFVVSAVLGDPTALIAGIIGSLIKA